MRDLLIDATEFALRSVNSERFFQTERGFQGCFYAALQERLNKMDLLVDGAILEMEYQKSARHDMGQRPDIIFHIPVEHSHANVSENNYAVWALKRKATALEAIEDFNKLDQMFNHLHYSIGFFINIDATDPMRHYYTGEYKKQLYSVAVNLGPFMVETKWAHD